MYESLADLEAIASFELLLLLLLVFLLLLVITLVEEAVVPGVTALVILLDLGVLVVIVDRARFVEVMTGISVSFTLSGDADGTTLSP
jgi:hypothetical protein